MTAPNGLGADRLRIGQRVIATSDHQAPTAASGYLHHFLRGDIGYVDYFWSDGRFIVSWKRHSFSPVIYDVNAWPGCVGPASEEETDSRPVAPDAREPGWAEAIARHFGGGSGP